MTFDVTLRFAGLCAHVPNTSLDDPAKPPTLMRILMARAINSKITTVAQHYPALFIEAADLESSDPLLASSPALTNGQVVLSLLRREVTFEPLLPAGVDPSTIGLTIPSTAPDFRRVPRMQAIAPKAATVHADCLADGKASFEKVIARIHLTHGTLSAEDFSGFPSIQFSKAGAPTQYAHETVAQLAGLEGLVIHLRDLDGNQPTEKLTVRPSGKAKTRITFGNLCGEIWLKELWGLQPYLETPDASGIVRDVDYEAFYLLCDSVPAKNRRPLPFWKMAGAGRYASCHQTIFGPRA